MQDIEKLTSEMRKMQGVILDDHGRIDDLILRLDGAMRRITELEELVNIINDDVQQAAAPSGYHWLPEQLSAGARRHFPRFGEKQPASAFRDISAMWRRMIECLRRAQPDTDAVEALERAGFTFERSGKYMYILRKAAKPVKPVKQKQHVEETPELSEDEYAAELMRTIQQAPEP